MEPKERFVVLHDMKEYEYSSYEEAITFIKRATSEQEKNEAMLIFLREGNSEFDDVVNIFAVEQLIPGCLMLHNLYI